MKQLLFLTFFTVGTFMVSFGAQKDSRTFEVNYMLSQETINAQIAKGDKTGRAIPANREIKFDFEPLSTTNYGLQVGNGCAAVLYSAKDHITKACTIELVVKNIDWEYGDSKVHLFLGSYGNSPLKIYLYKYRKEGVAIYLEAGKKKIFLRKMPEGWKLGESHHIAVTWFYDNVVLYLDGVKAAAGKFVDIEQLPARFYVGAPGKFGSDGNSAIGCVRMHNRALSSDEIANSATKFLPALKEYIKTAKNEKEKIMKSSPWFKNRPRLGLEALAPNYVPFPFTPVKLSGTHIKMWGRDYDFGGNNVVESITSAGEKLLRSPIRLEYTDAAGRVATVKFDSTKIVSADKGRVIFEKSGPNALLKGTIEYDGFVWFEIELKRLENLNTLDLIIPMTDEVAKAVHYIDTAARTDRITSAHSYTKELPQKSGLIFKEKFSSNVWVGSTRAGLQLGSESEENMYPYGKSDTYQILRNKDGVNWKFRLVTQKLPVSAPAKLKYRFGLIATPVKPLPPNWRKQTVSAQSSGIRRRGSTVVYWPNEWRQITLDPEPYRGLNPEKTKAKVIADHAKKRKVVPYWDRRHIPITQEFKDGTIKVNPDALKIYKEWSPIPQRQRGGRFDWMRVAGKGFYDYLVWCVDQWGERLGTIDGVYMDEMLLDPNINPISGGGYRDFDGKRRPTYSLLGERELYKRIHYVVAKRNPKAYPWSIAHNSSTNMMTFMSPFTICLTGEHLYSGYFTKMPERLPPKEDRLYYYSYSLPMEMVKYEFYNRQWGTVFAWLPCLKNQKDIMTRPETTRDMLSKVLHADTLFWPLFCNKEEIFKVDDFRNDFGIGDAEVVFTPYWENKKIIAPKENVIISYYKNKGKYLVIVSNLNRKKVSFQLDLKNIVAKEVKNAETMEKIPMDGSKIKLDMRRNDYVALRINY